MVKKKYEGNCTSGEEGTALFPEKEKEKVYFWGGHQNFWR